MSSRFPHQFRYPWPSVSAPHGKRLSDDAYAWATEQRLFTSERLARKFAAVEVGSLAALVYPGAPIDAQQAIADFLGWVFLEDDIFDEEDASSPERLARVLRAFALVLDGAPTPPGGPALALVPPDAPAALRALADVRARLATLGSDVSFRRFAASMKEFWFDGVLAEARQRLRPGLPSLSDYLELRMISVGALPCFDLIELAYGFTLAPAVLVAPDVVEMRRLGTLEIALTNDVFSYEKELKAGDPLNFVHLMHQHHRISLEESFERVISIHNDVVAAFDAIAADVERRSPALRLYVEGHRRWMRGAWDWQMAARRYAPSPEAVAAAV